MNEKLGEDPKVQLRVLCNLLFCFQRSFDPFIVGHCGANVPGMPVVLKVPSFLLKMAEDDFQTRLAHMAGNQFLPKYGALKQLS